MRNSDPIFWPGDTYNSSLVDQFDTYEKEAYSILQEQWLQADIDQRFVLGDQEIWGMLYGDVSDSRRQKFNFNITNNTIQMVSGYQRRNRKSSISIPIQTMAQGTADQFTKCLYYVFNKTRGYHVISDGFEQGALVQGFGLFSILKDLTTDPVSGEIRIKYKDFKSVIIDPFFRNKDLSDCRFIKTRDYMDKQEAKLLYPKFSEQIDEIPPMSSQDEQYYFMPENYQFQGGGLVAVDERWCLATREAEYLVDRETDETQEFLGDEEDLRHTFYVYGDRFKLIKKPKQTVKRYVMVNRRIMIEETKPFGLDRYPFVGVYGYFNPDTPYYSYKFKGMVRDLRDAQYLFNRRKVTDLDILEAQQQGLKMKKGALVKPEDGLNQGNGRLLVIDPRFSLDDVQPMPIIPPDPTMLQMEEMLVDVFRRISGVNEELLGSAQDDKAGILSMLRQGAGLTTLQGFFDNLDETQRQIGDLVIELIQKNWTYSKVKSVIGEEPTEEFENKAFFQYGTKIVQGVLTESQQQLEFQQLLHLFELTGGTQPILLERALEVSTIQEKDKLIERMQQAQEQAQQAQEEQRKLEMEQIQVDNATKLAYADSQHGLAEERKAKIFTDRAVAEDKLSRAETEDTASLLNLVKILKELQTVDTQNLLSKVDTLQRINSLEFDKKKEIREENVS